MTNSFAKMSRKSGTTKMIAFLMYIFLFGKIFIDNLHNLLSIKAIFYIDEIILQCDNPSGIKGGSLQFHQGNSINPVTGKQCSKFFGQFIMYLWRKIIRCTMMDRHKASVWTIGDSAHWCIHGAKYDVMQYALRLYSPKQHICRNLNITFHF